MSNLNSDTLSPKDLTVGYQGTTKKTTPYSKAFILGGYNPEISTISPIRDSLVPLNDSGKDYAGLSEEDENRERMGYKDKDQTRPLNLPTILGQCTFVFPTSDATLGVATSMPAAHGRRVFSLAAIVARTFNSPLNLPLFEEVTLSEGGFSTFKYVGKRPLHTVLQGSIKYLHRVRDADSIWQRTLILRPISGQPNIIKGDNSAGIQFISHQTGLGQELPRKLHHTDLYNGSRMADPSQGFDDIFAGPTHPDMFPGFDLGYFTGVSHIVGDDPEDLVNGEPEDPDNENNTRTTKWFDVKGGDYLYLKPIPEKATTTRCRIQYRKEKGGEIFYKSNPHGSQGYIQIPLGAVECRIYYKREQDTVQTLVIKNRTKASPGTLESVDPSSGYWVPVQLNINAPVTFWPGTIYSFQHYTVGPKDNEPLGTDYNFRIESGGITCLFDASEYLEEINSFQENF